MGKQPRGMFDIAMDECERTCSADELVRDKSAAEISNARKNKYFCVACVGEKHRVSLKVRHEARHVDNKSRTYTALAWFSHHGGGAGGAARGQDTPSPETAKHWHAKHILSRHVGRYYFTASKCKSCAMHTTLESGVGATGKVELGERTPEGKLYRFDAALVRGNPGSAVVSSVLEVWATHKTSEEKRQYCLDRGYSFGEFDADSVLDAHINAPTNTAYELKNLSIRYFECADCMQARKHAEIRAEHTRWQAEQVRLAEISTAEQRQHSEFVNKQFYSETCTGAETRILQLQEDLYDNFALGMFFGSIKTMPPHCIPLEVYTEEDDAILCIQNAVGWRSFHTQCARWEARDRDVEIQSGRLHLNNVGYEKGESIRCICKKWVHPVHSRPACVNVHEEQVHIALFERMVQDGARKYGCFSENPYIKMCGICANTCIFCKQGILQTQASMYGCCYPCFRDVPGEIEQMHVNKRSDIDAQIVAHQQSIAQIHAGDAFRGFVDFATEHRLRKKEIDDESHRIQHHLRIESQRKLEEENTKRDQEEQKINEEKKRADEVKQQDAVAQGNYEKWILMQSENVRKRKERDQQSHDRWLRARNAL